MNEEAFQAKLDACNTEAEREALIRGTLNGLYTDAASTYEKNNAQVLAQRDAQAKLQSTLADVGEAIAPLITAFTRFANQALDVVRPYIEDLAERLLPLLKEWLSNIVYAMEAVSAWIADNWGIVSTIATVILSIVAAFTAYNAVMKLVNAANAIFAANPIVLAIAAIIAIIVVCVMYWDEIKAAAVKAWEGIKNIWDKVANWFKTNVVDKIKQTFSDIGSWFTNIFTKARNGIQNAFSSITGFFSGIWEKIKNIFSKVGTAIADSIKNTVSSAVNKVLSTAVNIINGFISAINFAIGIINAIPGVNISKISKLEVPKMAKGGIVDSATLAVIGEQGKEAVVPLENNLEWLDKLSGMLADRMGGGNNQPIVLQVDGKVFAQTSIDTINQLTRQTGKLGLALV